MGATAIEWTDVTWNPTRGCSRVSEGCRNCYAERMAARFSGVPFNGFARMTGTGPRWTGRVKLIREKVNEPLHWRKPRRIFVNSMSDLFHERLSDGAILHVFLVMNLARQHTFQVLTKRPGRMVEWFRRWADLTGESGEPKLVRGPKATRVAHPSPRGRMFAEYLEALGKPPAGFTWPTFDWIEGIRWWSAYSFDLPNVWLGTSVENRATLRRLEDLRAVPRFDGGPGLRHVRWVSFEPLLEDLGQIDLRGIHWAVIGGESGPSARPCDVEWIRSIVRQCREARVACFVKQMGARWARAKNTGRDRACQTMSHSKGGDPAEWPEDLRVREFPRYE